MKEVICAWAGVVGGVIASLFGGFDAALVTLVIFMAVDYITGIVVAGVFKNSPKTEGGALDSHVGLMGLFRKGGMLLIVLIAARLQTLTDISFIRDAVVIAFITNETISIIENAGLMGIPIPQVLLKAIEVLKSKGEGEE